MLSQLTKKEKTVFYNLVKYPELNDNELSGKIQVKRTTITPIIKKIYNNRF